jgi:hypothetical protein
MFCGYTSALDSVRFNGYNLSNVPSTPINITGFEESCSLLICDPGLSVFRSTVQLLSNGTLLVQQSPSEPLIGNIDFNRTVSLLAASAWGGPFFELLDRDLAGYERINPFSSQISDSGLRVLEDVASMEAALDSLIAPVMKPYSAGYNDPNVSATFTVPSDIQTTRLGLIASKPLWIVAMTLVVTALMLVLTALITSGNDRQIFNLKNVSKAIHAVQRNVPESDALLRPDTIQEPNEQSLDAQILYDSHSAR